MAIQEQAGSGFISGAVKAGPGVILFALLALTLSGCGNQGGEVDVALGDVGFVGKDYGSGRVEGGDSVVETPDVEEASDLPASDSPPVEEDVPRKPIDDCGDGVCVPPETANTCAKDCMVQVVTTAFVFARKGDELGSLGRIYDLVQAGVDVYVFFLTFDDTPIETVYSDSPGKLSVASLGVPPANIYLYEKHIEWDIVSGNHEVLDRLVQHFGTIEPETVYLPQACGSDLESELAHVIGIWAAKRAKIFPTYYEVPAPSNYYVPEAPSLETAQTNPDLFVDQFIKRWRLIPKQTGELQPSLGPMDTAQIRLAASHIMNEWLQGFLYVVPEDKVLYLLREIQRFRERPTGQKTDEKPFVESLENPGATYIYKDQGYSFEEFRQRVRVVESFFGTNVRSEPSALPFFDDPTDVHIMHDFDVVLDIRTFSSEPDTLSFHVGFGPAKNETGDCVKPESINVSAMEQTTVTVECQAEEPIGQHTYYFRVYSKKAEEFNDALFTEVPFVVNVFQ